MNEQIKKNGCREGPAVIRAVLAPQGLIDVRGNGRKQVDQKRARLEREAEHAVIWPTYD